MYDCGLPDGTTKEYAANIIAENVLYEVDPDGYFSYELKAIVDHKRDGQVVPKANKYVANKNGQKKLRPTTIGWQLLCEWKNGSREWIDLKDMKECNPVQVAE